MEENKNILPPNLHGEALKEYLELYADQVREDDYIRQLSPDEITEHRATYSNAGLEKEQLEEELAAKRKEIKKLIDTIKIQMKAHSTAIKKKAIEVKGKIYTFKDFDNGIVYEYTEFGQLITDRRMRPEERQRTIQLNKTA
jgi:hypothetical protein